MTLSASTIRLAYPPGGTPAWERQDAARYEKEVNERFAKTGQGADSSGIRSWLSEWKSLLYLRILEETLEGYHA